MQFVTSKADLIQQLDEWREQGDHIALVPTMGNLHSGHISLIDEARSNAERTVVSVFVNPTQFGEGEDFDAYPRTIERDTRRLRQVKADLLFAPDVDTVYPFGIENATMVCVPGLTENFCGSFRPGHFDGVTTVVARLFALVGPDIAVFGQKDYQQQLVVRRMVQDLNLPIRIVTAPTVRDPDGVAMSSRNVYLSEDERNLAPILYRTLTRIGNVLQAGNRNFPVLEKEAIDELSVAGFVPEYVAIRRAEDLSKPDRDSDDLVVLAAARLGGARLIDNIVVTI